MCKHVIGHILYTIILLIFISSSIIQAQVDTLWTKTFGGSMRDFGESVQQTKDEGYIVVGTTGSFNFSVDVWLIKTNSSGDTLWTKTFGRNGNDSGYSIQQTLDEGYIILGMTSFSDSNHLDFWLIKTNASGDTLWTKTFGGKGYDYAHSIQQTTDEGYIITGTTSSFGAGNSDVWLIKTSVLGDTLWTKTFGKGGDDGGWSVEQTIDGGYIITGFTSSFFDNYISEVLWLIKTDTNGDTLWTKTYGGSGTYGGRSVQQTKDNGYIITGFYSSFGDSLNEGDLWLIKTDAKGDTLWTKTCGGNGFDIGYSIQQTKDGGYIVVGATNSFSNGFNDAWMIKISTKGDILWTKTFGGMWDDIGCSIQQTKDEGYIVVGTTNSFGAGNEDILLFKTTPDTVTTGINKNMRIIHIDDFVLEQNYPNPFNPRTTFNFSIPKSDQVMISIYSISGQVIESKIMNLNLGSYTYEFDGTRYSSGIYFYKISTSSGFTAGRKMVLLK